MKPTRTAFLAAARALERCPYRWNGKDARGVDCSGLVTVALRAAGGPDLRKTHWTDRFWLELDPVEEPKAGDLALYGRDNDPSHVVICLGGPHDPCIGANGGDSKVLTVVDAEREKAFVRVESSPAYWKSRLMGYRSMSRYLEDA